MGDIINVITNGATDLIHWFLSMYTYVLLGAEYGPGPWPFP